MAHSHHSVKIHWKICLFLNLSCFVYLFLTTNAYEINESHNKSPGRIWQLSLCWRLLFSGSYFNESHNYIISLNPLLRKYLAFPSSRDIHWLRDAPYLETVTLVNNENRWKPRFKGLSCFPVQSTEKLLVTSKSIRWALRVEFTSVWWATSKRYTIYILPDVLLGKLKWHLKGLQAVDLQLEEVAMTLPLCSIDSSHSVLQNRLLVLSLRIWGNGASPGDC